MTVGGAKRLFYLTLFSLAWSPVLCFEPAQAASLEDTLYEKGVLTKEEVQEIKAEKEKKAERQEKRLEEEFPVKVEYGRPGFSIFTRDGRWRTRIRLRFQGRYSYPTRSDPRTFSAFEGDNASTFEIRRARLKIGGHGYKPWIKHYLEADFQPGREFDDGSANASTRLITWRLEVEKYKALSLRVGQWKSHYNRERVDSSGKQQFVERSIVNRTFTIDRQVGAQLYGHLFRGTFADLRYWATVHTGLGRGVVNDDANMMYVGRLQWNFLGRDLPFQQSDVEFHEQPAGSLAGAIATDISPCTRFSSSGCGNLDFDSAGQPFPSPSAAEPGQFRIDQWVEEFAFKYRGLSIQHEYHWKQIKDLIKQRQTNMMGSYSEIGYFPHYVIQAIPKPLELAFRYAFVDENIFRDDDKRQEFTGVVNWFFAGHNNKLTVDFSHLTLGRNHVSVVDALGHPASDTLTEQRVRVQWDVTF